jgi:prevent-host-death family protein
VIRIQIVESSRRRADCDAIGLSDSRLELTGGHALWLDPSDRKRHTIRMEAGVRELRDHLSHYLNVVRDGQEVTVTDHGKAVARLVPLDRPRALDRLIAEGLVTPAPAAKRPRTPLRITAKGTVSDLVAEQRQ